ncbi:MAG: DUF4365 domain-containing protein [Flavobacterium sp.]|nr:MAG: DUF4365 domain-containing protein [Flavobacterium sp.]
MKSKGQTKKRDDFKNTDIQNAADIMFRAFIADLKISFPDLFWRLTNEETQLDKGIDYQVEVEDRKNRQSLIIFKTQNKGTEKQLKPLKSTDNEGMIPFQITIRHANYYRNEINIGLVYIICDLESKIIYWHSIQLDDALDDAAQAAAEKGQDSITMYISPSNQLNAGTLPKFMNEVMKSGQVQHYRYHKKLNHTMLTGYDQTIIDKTRPILAQLGEFTRQVYKELRFQPLDLLIYYYPLSKGSTDWRYHSGFKLESDHKELVDFLDTVHATGDGKIIFEDPATIGEVDDPEKVFKEFSDHMISNGIRWIGYKDKTASIYLDESTACGCSNCKFRDLEFKESLSSNQVHATEIPEMMKAAYVSYQFGNYITSAQQFMAVLKKATDLPVTTLICEYNLSKLGSFIRNNYFNERDSISILKEIKKIDLKLSVEKHRTKNNEYLLQWIAEGKSIKKAQETLRELLHKIREHHHIQLTGGWASNSHAMLLYSAFTQLDNFLLGNYVIYDQFLEFEEIASMFTEAVYASYSLSPDQEGRLDSFDDWIIDKFIFHGVPAKLMAQSSLYKIKEIKYKSPSKSGNFMQLLRNLLQKNDYLLTDVDQSAEYGRNNFRKRYKNIICNMIILASQLEMSEKDVNEALIMLMGFFRKKEIQAIFNNPFFNIFIHSKKVQISHQNLKKLFQLSATDPFFADEEMIEYVTGICRMRNLPLKLSKADTKKLIHITFGKKETTYPPAKIDNICYYYELLDESGRREVSKQMELHLQCKFSIPDYYMAALYDILPINSAFFEEFKARSVPKPIQPGLSGIFGSNMNNSSYTDMFINLCLKNQIDLSDSDFNQFRGKRPYYDWLTNMKAFDYEAFEVKWLLENQTIYLLTEIKKHAKIPEKLKQFLAHNQHPQLERFYIDHFID